MTGLACNMLLDMFLHVVITVYALIFSNVYTRFFAPGSSPVELSLPSSPGSKLSNSAAPPGRARCAKEKSPRFHQFAPGSLAKV